MKHKFRRCTNTARLAERRFGVPKCTEIERLLRVDSIPPRIKGWTLWGSTMTLRAASNAYFASSNNSNSPAARPFECPCQALHPPTKPLSNAAANDASNEPADAQWAEIVQQLGVEIAGPLSAAPERIHQLVNTGQIDRQSLRALRESAAQAHEAGMVGQQLVRLASGRLRLSRERMHLTQILRSVLAQRSRETRARGIQIPQVLQPVAVMTDGTSLFALFALLTALMD